MPNQSARELISRQKFAYQRTRTADAAARKQRRSEFVSGLVHDLNNPLGVVQLLSELLLDGDAGALTPEQTELMHRIHASVRRALMVTGNVLESTRLKAGHPARRATASLADIVELVVTRARSAALLKEIDLTWSAATQPSIIDIDATQIERVVTNLVDNAIKYTPRGGKVSATISSVPGELILAIQDTGCGIAAAELPTIFEKYRGRATPGAIDGSGLGLLVVKAIVAAHGGSVRAGSVVGQGTTITVRLPTAPADVRHPPTTPAPRPRRRWQWN